MFSFDRLGSEQKLPVIRYYIGVEHVPKPDRLMKAKLRKTWADYNADFNLRLSGSYYFFKAPAFSKDLTAQELAWDKRRRELQFAKEIYECERSKAEGKEDKEDRSLCEKRFASHSVAKRPINEVRSESTILFEKYPFWASQENSVESKNKLVSSALELFRGPDVIGYETSVTGVGLRRLHATIFANWPEFDDFELFECTEGWRWNAPSLTDEQFHKFEKEVLDLIGTEVWRETSPGEAMKVERRDKIQEAKLQS